MKKLFIISEEEKKRILNLHIDSTKNQYLKKNVISEATAVDVQTKLKELGFGTMLGTGGQNKDGIDGRIGPKTIDAIMSALTSTASSNQSVTTTTTTAATGGSTGATGAQGVTTTTTTAAAAAAGGDSNVSKVTDSEIA